MSRPFASVKQKLVVRGIVTNRTQSALSGVTIQLMSSGSPFSAPSQLQGFAAGRDPAAVGPEPRALDKLRGTLAPGVTVHWTAVLPVNEVGMGVFGVYPLAAQATDSPGHRARHQLVVPAVLAVGQEQAAPAARRRRLDLAADRHARPGSVPRSAEQPPGGQPGQRRATGPAARRRRRPGRAGSQADLGDRPRAAVQCRDHGGRAAQVALPGRREAGLRAG